MISKYEELDFKSIGNNDGHLIPLESNKNIPFEIKRVYYIFKTKIGIRRGYHAHKQLKQILICVSGFCTVFLDTGSNQDDIKLSSPSQGLLIEGLVWHEMYNFSEDCVLMVLADDYYNEDDYIRDYKTFKKAVHEK